jgi:flagellar biosynthesis protein FliQ
MKKFSEYLFKANKGLLFLGMFVLCLIIGLIIEVCMLSTDLGWKLLVLPTIIGIMCSGMFTTMLMMANKAEEFFDKANELEELIKKDCDKDAAISMLYKLQEKSFHRTTGSRVRELAKMMEIKYNINIIKN